MGVIEQILLERTFNLPILEYALGLLYRCAACTIQVKAILMYLIRSSLFQPIKAKPVKSIDSTFNLSVTDLFSIMVNRFRMVKLSYL